MKLKGGTTDYEAFTEHQPCVLTLQAKQGSGRQAGSEGLVV